MPGDAAGASRPAPESATEAEGRPGDLAHVAAVSFLAARAAPSGGFWIALAGGVALARAGEGLGLRRGYGASVAALLQSVAIIGPARLGVPLTQGLSAPLLGRMECRGRGVLAQVLACAAIRTVQNALGTAFLIGIVTGVDAYAGSYDRTVASLLPLPEGTAGALAVTAAGLLAWSAFASTIQVLVYRRGLVHWRTAPPDAPADEVHGGEPDPREGSDGTASGRVEEGGSGQRRVEQGGSSQRRFDPRAVALGAALVFGLLLVSTSWVLVAAVAVWLAVTSVAAAPLDRDVIPAGVALAAVLAAGALAFGTVGGLGLDLTLRRAARAGLLVLVATWLRAAAGSDGVRAVAGRALRRLHFLPSAEEARRDLDAIGAAPRLAASARALFGSLRRVSKRPIPVVDAVLSWVRLEAAGFRPAAGSVAVAMRVGAWDAALLALVAVPAWAVAAGP